MAQPATRMEARAEASTPAAKGDGNNWTSSEQHAEMEAFRQSLKDQNALDKSYAAVSAKSQRSLNELSKSIDRTLDCLTDFELVDAKALAHKINEERKAHHGQSDTMDALNAAEHGPHKADIHQTGRYNAVVLAAAVESHGHVMENRYIPANGGKSKSNDNEHAVTHSPADTEKFDTLHPVKKGMPTPID